VAFCSPGLVQRLSVGANQDELGRRTEMLHPEAGGCLNDMPIVLSN